MATASLGGFVINGGPLADTIAKQQGYSTADQQAAYGAWTPDKWQGNLSPELLRGVTQQGWTVDPSANISGSAPAQFTYDPSGMISYHPGGQGAGENYYTYDNTGKFTGTQKGSGIMSYLQGILAVAGAGAGFGAVGGLGAGAAAGDAGGFVGEGAASGVPAWDSALSGATAGQVGAGTAAAGGLGSMTSGTGGNLLTKLGLSGLSSALGGNGARSGIGNMNLADLANLAGGVYGANQQGQAAGKMLDWMKGQQSKIDNLYAPNSPEFNYLWNQMSAQDAAAGRNSQYGPRSVDLAGKIAQIKADATSRLTGYLANPYQNALNQDAAKGANITAPLGSLLSRAGGGLTLDNILKLLGGGGGADLSNVPFNYGDSGSSPVNNTNYFDPTGWGGGTGGASYNIPITDFVNTWGQ